MKFINTEGFFTLEQCCEIIKKSDLSVDGKNAALDITNHIYGSFDKRVSLMDIEGPYVKWKINNDMWNGIWNEIFPAVLCLDTYGMFFGVVEDPQPVGPFICWVNSYHPNTIQDHLRHLFIPHGDEE
jgi:hypothetical protein